MAQLGVPDMRLPIAYALNYPERLPQNLEPLNLTEVGKLTFEEADRQTFECLQLAYDALEAGGACCTALNAANEVCVAAFLAGRIPFLSIQETLKKLTEKYASHPADTIEEILKADSSARTDTADFLYRD